VSYSLQIKSSAAKDLEKIPKADRLRLVQAIDRLRDAPLAGGTLKGEFGGLRRLRVGHYRVIYEVFEWRLVVLVVRVAHRREAYRRLR
jgi:mRNA interferase RelE/StbE